VVRVDRDGMKAELSLVRSNLKLALKASELSESDLQGLQMEISGGHTAQSNVITFKNADGSYNRKISLLCAELGTVGRMSAATLNRNMRNIIQVVTGETLDPSNKFSRHYVSDQIYLGEGLSQEACKGVMEEGERQPDAPPWTVGHDGTGVYG
jgi:hypothetical protein